MQQFISVAEARTLVLQAVRQQPAAPTALAEALGRTLREEIRSRDDIPPFRNSAMDGYAVRAADLASLPATLRVIEDIPAGALPQQPVVQGTCARIMTGAPFPRGADAVVPVEWTASLDGGRVRFERAPEPGQHVRDAGKDVKKGAPVFEAGQVITPPVVGMLATLGFASVATSVPPAVAVIATGDELVDVSAALEPGQIRNANGPALAAQVQHAGGYAFPPLLARDDEAHIRSVIQEALAADVLVFSGGVSVGDYDFVKQVLDDLGMELLFWKVRQRPGKPLAFGLLHGKPIFGLPGNPVSSAMCFEQYVRPAVAAMLGRREVMRPLHPAVLHKPIKKGPGLYHFVRGRAFYDQEGSLYVDDTGPQDSNLYSSFVQANCIIHLPEPTEDPPAGTLVAIAWLAW